jgi:predicted phosphodiesterase
MKLAIASDIHLDFGDLILKNKENADILILAGDILATDKFLQNVSEEFPQVIMIMGNHEYYENQYNEVEKELRNKIVPFSNITLLEKECKKIDDITFIGTVLWTDMNKRDPLTMVSIQRMMMDFNLIFKENKFFSAEDSCNEHERSFDYIKHCLAEKTDEKFVVITHHSPSFRSCHPSFKNQKIMNGAFHSNLDDFIFDRPQIKLWIHGHTHSSFDYMINETRIVCNPRGYVGYEKVSVEYAPKIVEV